MMTFLLVLFWIAALVFVVACIARIIIYARTPIHLRWELYPVPHEEPEKVAHGGSYFEEVNWWEKPRKKNLVGELAAMIPEILFLKGLWEFNRPLWFRSWPFHFGLYLLIGSGCLILITALLSIGTPDFPHSGIGRVFHWVYTVAGGAGCLLVLIGAIGLFFRRLSDEVLRIYSSRWDFFNLLFFIITFGLLAVTHIVRPQGYQGPLALMIALLTFNTSFYVPGLFALAVTLLFLLIAYVPLTHMSHFIGKYFTYHAVRWNDEPNMPGSELERRIAQALALRPTWAAPHVKADGRRTWAELAQINPAREGK